MCPHWLYLTALVAGVTVTAAAAAAAPSSVWPLPQSFTLGSNAATLQRPSSPGGFFALDPAGGGTGSSSLLHRAFLRYEALLFGGNCSQAAPRVGAGEAAASTRLFGVTVAVSDVSEKLARSEPCSRHCQIPATARNYPRVPRQYEILIAGRHWSGARHRRRLQPDAARLLPVLRPRRRRRSCGRRRSRPDLVPRKTRGQHSVRSVARPRVAVSAGAVRCSVRRPGQYR